MKNIPNDFGDYSRQVVIQLPNIKERIQCDYELASEIAYLNMIGIKTIASCSGHGIYVPTISVDEKHVDNMIELGYVKVPIMNGTDCTFYAKTNVLEIFKGV